MNMEQNHHQNLNETLWVLNTKETQLTVGVMISSYIPV